MPFYSQIVFLSGIYYLDLNLPMSRISLLWLTALLWTDWGHREQQVLARTIDNVLSGCMYLVLSVLLYFWAPMSFMYSFSMYLLGLYYMLRGSANFFYKWTDRKYFRLHIKLFPPLVFPSPLLPTPLPTSPIFPLQPFEKVKYS